MTGPGGPTGTGELVGLVGLPPRHRAARVPLQEPGELTGEARELYDAIVSGPRAAQRGTVALTDDRGRLLGPFGLMLLAPGVGAALQQVGAAIRFGTTLSDRQRELAILAVAAQVRSRFEWTAHEPAARTAGLGTSELQAVLDGRVPDGLDAAEEMAVRVAFALSRSRELDDAGFRAAEAALGRTGLAELTWLVGYYSALALALDVFRPPLDGDS